MTNVDKNLVSVIIPCYNAERWITEAIESCLAQTHRPLEIVVVDDGSTDRSVEILQSYENRIQLHLSPHRGGCYARNLGFAHSRGQFIQYLDADDYLLPRKIERQLAVLQSTGADVVYGDWRHQFHKGDGIVSLGKVQVSGAQRDVLESLLGGWSSTNMTLLIRREAIERTAGWDEALASGQDLDFFLSLAISGAKILYQSGCNSIYRRYGNVTVSTRNHHRWLDNQWKLFSKAEQTLREANRFSDEYRKALARSYFFIARAYYDFDRGKYAAVMEKALTLDPAIQPEGTRLYRLIYLLFGIQMTDRLASQKRRMLRAFRSFGGVKS